MRVTLLPSAYPAGIGQALQFATSYVVNDTVAIDAGCIGFWGGPDAQGRIKHVLISHSHIDHVASLPVFIENAYTASAECVTVYGSEAVLDSLQRDIFNNRLWPDFVALSPPHSAAPFLRLEVLKSGHRRQIDGLTICPVPVEHVVPTQGFLISDDESSIVISSDTGPTEALWHEACAVGNVKAVFVEVTFPNSLSDLAVVSQHMTPAMLADELQKIPPDVPVFAVHLKARFRETVLAEIEALKLRNVQVASFGEEYVF